MASQKDVSKLAKAFNGALKNTSDTKARIGLTSAPVTAYVIDFQDETEAKDFKSFLDRNSLSRIVDQNLRTVEIFVPRGSKQILSTDEIRLKDRFNKFLKEFNK